MGLNCELSPLVFAELYRMLAGSSAHADLLEERLDEIGQDLSWLTEAADRYEKTWQRDLEFTTEPLDDAHALLASWLLAPLRAGGSSYDFGVDLRTRVTERVFAEVPQAPSQLPAMWKPVVVGWTLGMVVGDIDQNLPVAPAMLPQDPNVRTAYEGLVEHVLHLSKLTPPWPEMMGTSTFWRGTGLAEGMQPEAENGSSAVTQLVVAVRRGLPEHVGKQIGRHFTQFAERRNTLSHIANKAGQRSFAEVREDAREWEQIRLTIMGITQFLCSQIAVDLTESASRAVREETWEELIWQLAL
ncbi:hypothetical protein JIG36_20225 [Actinoplanes sp. LDG1-06]|uniref:Apea-like HEPN domain-containing protein n=1 Tax=Paractinoplanes ovalisporus TaxID=2810368 RepID=A0ABS2ADH8_9ACTN|nr:hypothetical protein [Actinoplanes ovalisporus]MBM2617887.1 hypothetical protein [Actinoplanes ovalisporus]